MEPEERLKEFLERSPQVDASAYIAHGAHVLGAVTLAPLSSVWPGTVLRGDINTIEIGEGSNVQDGTVVHLADNYGVKVGKYVTIGHMAMIHACEIGDECLIGMHATVLDGAVIGEQSIIGAHSLVTKGMQVPPGSVVMGVPGKIVKSLDADSRAQVREWAEKYVKVSRYHMAKFGSAQPWA